MPKLLNIYNFAPHYRSSIFKLMSEELDCDFLFGDLTGDIKRMDYSLLRGKVTETHTKRLRGGWYWQRGVVASLFKDYDQYILLGETRALSTWTFCLLARVFRPKKKVYFWSHGWYGKETRIETFLKKIFFHLPNGGTFLYGNYARGLMIKQGFSPDKLYVIHNSLSYDKQLSIREALTHSDVYRNRFKNDNPNIIFIGRLTKIKRIDLLLEALAQLKRDGHWFNLTLIGDGVAKAELEQKVKELNLTDNVWFYGTCYDEQENAMMIYNADLCVSPGNVGLTAMHVMMFGCPVLTHDNFAHQMPEFEAIHKGVTGDSFKQNDIQSLAKAIKDWFDKHSDDRNTVRNACYHEIDTQWTPEFQIEVLKSVLTK